MLLYRRKIVVNFASCALVHVHRSEVIIYSYRRLERFRFHSSCSKFFRFFFILGDTLFGFWRKILMIIAQNLKLVIEYASYVQFFASLLHRIPRKIIVSFSINLELKFTDRVKIKNFLKTSNSSENAVTHRVTFFVFILCSLR